MRARILLLVMSLLQALWVSAIWVAGVAASAYKLPPLLLYTVLTGLAVAAMPTRLVARIRAVWERLLRKEWLLLCVLCATVLLAGGVYAGVQRAYMDESYSFAAARIVAEEGVGPFFAQYASLPWLGRQHPPLAPLLYGFAMRIFGVHRMVIRLVSLGLTLATTLLTYALGCDLYDRGIGFAAAWLLLAMPLFLRIGSAALTDMPVTFFFALAMFAALRLLHTPAWRSAAIAGLAIGAGLLSKYTAVFVYPVLLGCFAVGRKVRQRRRHLGLIVLISGGILALWLVFAYQRGILAAQSERLAFYAGVVTTTSGGRRWMLEAVFLRLPSGLGTYNLPLILLGAWQLMQERSSSDQLIGLWIAVVAVLLILTLPDPRYFLPIFPALAITMAHGLRRIPGIAEQAIILALFYCGGALYLFADWYRIAEALLR